MQGIFTNLNTLDMEIALIALTVFAMALLFRIMLLFAERDYWREEARYQRAKNAQLQDISDEELTELINEIWERDEYIK